VEGHEKAAVLSCSGERMQRFAGERAESVRTADVEHWLSVSCGREIEDLCREVTGFEHLRRPWRMERRALSVLADGEDRRGRAPSWLADDVAGVHALLVQQHEQQVAESVPADGAAAEDRDAEPREAEARAGGRARRRR